MQLGYGLEQLYVVFEVASGSRGQGGSWAMLGEDMGGVDGFA